MEEQEQKQTIKSFLKENIYFLILAGVAILFSVIVIISSLTQETKPPVVDNNINKEPVATTITYYLPVANASIIKDYSATELQYNATLNQWEAHKSIDFLASAGSAVKAITAGEVVEVYNNYLEGTVVKIKHANGLISEYGSLDEDVEVEVGDNVEANATIGYVGATANAEANDGAHLHFTMYDNNGKKIDPSGYLNISNK
ncbi:MAG: M23 family metallopeptidase [Clostridiales bacterium]|nr:M23 family metallopeptidase [Clostridiales bacterium]